MFLKRFHLYSGLTNPLFTVLPLCLLMSCRQETPSYTDAKTVKLDKFETMVAFEDNILATPKVIRYDGDSTLFIYDAGKAKVLELDGSGGIVNEFGRRGRGPGEFQIVNNMFLTDNHIYIVDYAQYLIHKFDRHGELNSSMDYGVIGGLSSGGPPIPFSPSVLRVENIDNQPFVTLKDNVLLSPVRFNQPSQTIYELRDWEGNHIADVGEVPEGSSFVIDTDEYRTAIENREVPAIYKPNAFPVHDHADPDEYFLVYSAIPRIGKYNSAGQKLWETEIPRTPEVDSLTTNFYEGSEQDYTSRIGLRKYISGVNSYDGDLFLVANKPHYFSYLTNRPLWIHQFDTTGKLIRRYKLISEDVDLLPIFDIDFPGRRIFVVTEEAEIRAYSF